MKFGARLHFYLDPMSFYEEKPRSIFEVRYQICFDTKATFWEAQQSLLKTLTLVESTMSTMLTLPTAGLQPWWRTHNSDTCKAYLYLYSKNGVLWTMVSAHTFPFHVSKKRSSIEKTCNKLYQESFLVSSEREQGRFCRWWWWWEPRNAMTVSKGSSLEHSRTKALVTDATALQRVESIKTKVRPRMSRKSLIPSKSVWSHPPIQ